MKTKTKLLTGAALLAGAGAVAAKKYADNKDTVRKPVEITNQLFNWWRACQYGRGCLFDSRRSC